MFKKFVFLTVLIFITLTAWKQDPNAKTWERHNTTVSADNTLAAIERGGFGQHQQLQDMHSVYKRRLAKDGCHHRKFCAYI
jgi:hypothetical protein